MAVAQFLLFAPTQVEMLHLAETEGAKPRQISWALVAGALGGVLLGGYFMMVWAYGKGSENIPYMNTWAVSQNWYFNPLRDALTQMDAQTLKAAATGTKPEAIYPAGPLAAVGVGSGITLLLSFLRTQFVGFWVHPIGYVLANTHFINACWGSILAAWIIKGAALKISGPRLIREILTPWFVGVFLGGVIGMAFWDGVALVALSQGSRNVFTCWP